MSWVAVAHYCFAKKDPPWVREVHAPDGVIIGGAFYPEALGSGLVENVHRFNLEKSKTFLTAYRDLLRFLDKKFGHERTTHAGDIRAELAGTYVLPAPPQPKQPEPKPQPKSKPEAPSVPDDAEILEQGRIKLLNQLRLQEPNVSSDARRFLDGV